ncbi:hypothetical protein H4582DRAFT_2053641 [Lactarius indigo]|nr:hypothetical protein H4582DRAFT_2053641 [Lactarius indigo]
MPPQRRIYVDKLTADEKALMGTAIRFDLALRYREKNIESVDDDWYRTCIASELDDVNEIFGKYSDGTTEPRMHPIITYVAEEWDSAADSSRVPDIAALKLKDVSKLCNDGAANNPLWNSQLNMKTLNTLIGLLNPSDRWWLPALHSDVDDIPDAPHVTPPKAGSKASGKRPAPPPPDTGSDSGAEPSGPVPASVQDATMVNEDVEMQEDDGGETPRKPKKATKRVAVQSPTAAHRTTRRRRTTTGAGDVPSSPEPEPTELVPVRPVPMEPVSGVPLHAAVPTRTKPVNVTICATARMWPLQGCKPQMQATTRREEGNSMQVVYEAEAQWVATGKEDGKGKKKQSLDEVVQRLDDMSNTQEAHIAAMRDFVHNTDVILRALRTQGPEPGPSTPSASSVASGTSGAPSTVSSMGLGRMMISDAGVAGPSEVPPDRPQAPASRQSLWNRSSRAGTSSGAQSRVGSHQSSRGRYVQDVSEAFQAWDVCNIYMRIMSTSQDTGACIWESRAHHRTFPAWFPSKVSGCFRQGFQDQYGTVLKQSAHAPYWVHTQESQVMGTSRARSWNVLKHSRNTELLCVGVRTIQAVTHIPYLLHAGNIMIGMTDSVLVGGV